MKCEKCNKEHDGSYGSGRFCSSECSHSYSTFKDSNLEFKKSKCCECECDILIKKRSPHNVKCDKCNK